MRSSEALGNFTFTEPFVDGSVKYLIKLGKDNLNRRKMLIRILPSAGQTTPKKVVGRKDRSGEHKAAWSLGGLRSH
ncbi:hypothetical protein Leryth_011621 [Lithospermum erythrorhizon]|nr:hypothetical protein Leryth_011621 [Lithospermum erythrorhizon]